MLKNHKVALAVAAAIVGAPVQAGGLYLQEFATPSTATAGAGATAMSKDASTALHNPAAMSQLESNQFMLGGGLVVTNAQFDVDDASPNQGGDGGNAGGVLPSLSFAYVNRLNEKWSLGVSNFALAGAALDYEDDWAGRYQAQDVTLLTSAMQFSTAYKVNEQFSLGLGLTYLYGKIEQDIAVPRPGEGDGALNVDVDGGDFGMTASLFWSPTSNTDIGLAYASSLKPDLEGDVDLSPSGLGGGTTVDVTFPETVRLGISHKTDGAWTLLGQFNWENWSSLDSIDFNLDSGRFVATPRNWQDTYTFGIGAHYQYSPKVVLMAGTSYTTSSVETKYRTADLPVDEQFRIAFGVERQLEDNRSMTMSLEYVDLGEAPIDQDGLTGLKGEFDRNSMVVATFSFNWG